MTTTNATTWTTRIKALDLFAPLARGGVTTLTAPAGVGCLVLLLEILTRAEAPVLALGAASRTIHEDDFSLLFRDLDLPEGYLRTTLVPREADREQRGEMIRDVLHQARDRAEDDVIVVLDATALANLPLPSLVQDVRGHVTVIVFEALLEEGASPSKAIEAASDTIVRFDPRLARAQIWPALDTLASRSTLLDPQTPHLVHTRAMLEAYRERLELGESDVEDARAHRLELYLSQPFVTAETFTGMPGTFVTAERARDDLERLLRGDVDDWPEERIYMQGPLDRDNRDSPMPLFA